MAWESEFRAAGVLVETAKKSGRWREVCNCDPAEVTLDGCVVEVFFVDHPARQFRDDTFDPSRMERIWKKIAARTGRYFESEVRQPTDWRILKTNERTRFATPMIEGGAPLLPAT